MQKNLIMQPGSTHNSSFFAPFFQITQPLEIYESFTSSQKSFIKQKTIPGRAWGLYIVFLE